jgi:hypothetical protein
MNPDECEEQLIEFTQRLNPVLNPLGFVFESSGSGVASAGPFAAGFYVNGEKKIGLIYRSIAGFGEVIYEYNQTGVSHSELMHYLGKQDESRLKYDTNKFLSYSKDSENVLDVLVYDIRNFEIEFLTSSNDQFSNTLKEISKIRNKDFLPDSKIMESIVIGMLFGGTIGFMLQSLGWGIFIGFVIGLSGGMYVDIQRDRKNAGK